MLKSGDAKALVVSKMDRLGFGWSNRRYHTDMQGLVLALSGPLRVVVIVAVVLVVLLFQAGRLRVVWKAWFEKRER